MLACGPLACSKDSAEFLRGLGTRTQALQLLAEEVFEGNLTPGTRKCRNQVLSASPKQLLPQSAASDTSTAEGSEGSEGTEHKASK